MNALTFRSTTLAPIPSTDGQIWLRLLQIEGALGYSPSTKGKALNLIYQKHAAEFTSSMTRLMELDTAGGRQAVRVFSLRGAHLLAMFARTSVAAEFRRWVLDVLDVEVSRTVVGLRESEAFNLSGVLKLADTAQRQLSELEPALRAVDSAQAPRVHSIAAELRFFLGVLGDLRSRLV